MSLGPLFRPFILLGCVAAMGCGTWTEERNEELRVLEGNRLTGSLGLARVKIPLTSADKSMLLQVRPQDGYFSYVTSIEDQDGNVLYDFKEDVQRSRQRSGAAYASDLTVLNWPVSSDDAFLTGEEVVVVVAGVDEGSQLNASVKLEIQALLKADTDWEKGELYIHLFYAGSTAQDEAIRSAVTAALEVSVELLSGIGVTASIETKDWGQGIFPKPGTGSPGEFLALAEDSPLRTLNLVIVPSIYESEALLGTTGSIPGPLVPTDRSAVLISAAANAGPDLDFSALEVRLLAETMTHEMGHYMGLFHPVESTWDLWDALGDTEECDELQICEDLLGVNMMFPYPVCDELNCEIQDALTDEQQAVIHRYAGVW